VFAGYVNDLKQHCNSFIYYDGVTALSAGNCPVHRRMKHWGWLYCKKENTSEFLRRTWQGENFRAVLILWRGGRMPLWSGL